MNHRRKVCLVIGTYTRPNCSLKFVEASALLAIFRLTNQPAVCQVFCIVWLFADLSLKDWSSFLDGKCSVLQPYGFNNGVNCCSSNLGCNGTKLSCNSTCCEGKSSMGPCPLNGTACCIGNCYLMNYVFQWYFLTAVLAKAFTHTQTPKK